MTVRHPDLRPTPVVHPLIPVRPATLAMLAVLFVAAVCAFVFKVSGSMIDFDVYWRAGSRAAAAEPLYRVEDGHYQFKYLPAFAVLMAPISGLDLATAKAVWFGASVVLLVLLLRTSLRLLPSLRKPPWVLIAATVVVMGKFYAHELLLGQANLAFGVVGAGALLALAHGRETTGGVLVAVAIVLKPYGVVLLPWLLARRRWPSIAASFTGLAVALLAPALAYGLAGNVAQHRAWWATVTSTTAPNLMSPDNVSWLAMYTRWIGEGPAATGATLVTAGLVAAAGLWTWSMRNRVKTPDLLEGALLLLLIPLASPQGWDYVLLVSTPAVMLLVNHEDRLPRGLRWPTIVALGIVGLAIYDVLGRDAYRAFMLASGITVCYFVVIAALVSLRVQRLA